jgi:hypothetical protein
VSYGFVGCDERNLDCEATDLGATAPHNRCLRIKTRIVALELQALGARFLRSRTGGPPSTEGGVGAALGRESSAFTFGQTLAISNY